MAHFKCLPCRARVWRAVSSGESQEHPCPGCGRELEAVTSVSELVGLRALVVRPRATHPDATDRSERISQQIRETIAGHDAERRRRIESDHGT